MKKGSFTGLLYREYYLGKHSCFAGLLLFAGFAAVCWLALLSLRYGNLSLILSSAGKYEQEISEAVRFSIDLTVRFAPAVGAACLSFAPADIAGRDILTSWRRFEHCTPVTPLKYAAVKLTATVLAAAASFLLTFLHIAGIGAATGSPVSYTDFSLIVLIVGFMTTFSVLAQFFILLLGSLDYGMLTAMLTVSVPVLIISFLNRDTDTFSDKAISVEERRSRIAEFINGLCPVMLAVTAGVLVLLFVSMYLLYKRREK